MTNSASSPGKADTSNPAPLQAGSLIKLALVSLLVGMLTGLVAALFRLALQRADQNRDALIHWAHGRPLMGFLFVVGLVAAMTGIASWLVRRFSPQAGGSGIPHVFVSGPGVPA